MNEIRIDMKKIVFDSHEPAFCLAAEEYLLSNKTSGDWLMLWSGKPSVIVGKFQNVYSEVSLNECEKNGVRVYRRNSGGGTVYHDLGNTNYTIITDKSENLPDYSRFLTPIIAFLSSLGVDSEIRDTSALFIGEKKISGNAQSVVGNRVMHHGTLLFDADLDAIKKLTGKIRTKVKSKAILSNPSPVTNIKPFLKKQMSVSEFTDSLGSFLSTETYAFSDSELKEIKRLAEDKYSSFEWTYARSPAFTLTDGDFTISVRHGLIESVSEYADHLVGIALTPENIVSSLPSKKEAEIIKEIIFS